MSRLVIVEGNSNDKDNVRLLIVKGEKGADGVSPTVTTSKENGIATISITDKNGTKSVSVSDGVTPTASVTRDNTNKKSVITITDANGTTAADANDGVSPTVSVSKSNGVTTIEITDADGTHTATINDGEVTNAALTAALADYKLKSDIAVVTGTISLTNGTGSANLDYPTGFDSSNCVAVSVGIAIVTPFSYFSYDNMVFSVRLTSSNVVVTCTAVDNVGSTATKDVKVVLMKVS